MAPAFRVCVSTATLLFVTPMPADARKPPAAIASIKQVYKDVVTGIHTKRFTRRTLTIKTVVPAIGEQERVLTFYVRPSKEPARVIVGYNVAARTGYRDDFIFDEKGALVFVLGRSNGIAHKDCSAQDTDVYTVQRHYLQAGKVLRVITSFSAEKRSALREDCARYIKQRKVVSKPQRGWQQRAVAFKKRAAAFRRVLAGWRKLGKRGRHRLLLRSEGMGPVSGRAVAR